MWAVLQAALLLGPSRPLVNPGRDSSLLPSGRTHRPGSPAVQYPGVPPARLAPCLHRPSCHPPARAGVTGITSLLLLSPSRTHGLPGLSFLAHSHPSRPRGPGVLHSSRPHPVHPSPTLLRFKDENTEFQDIKRLGQIHTLDSNPGPGAPESPLSPHGIPFSCFPSQSHSQGPCPHMLVLH